MTVLTIEGIPVTVHRKKIKNLHLYVKPPDGRVLVTAPCHMSDEIIEQFVRGKTDWLTKHITRFENQPARAIPEYQTGEAIPVWGREYRLLVRHGGRNAVALAGDTVVLTARSESTAAQREKILREWYREQLKAEITRRLPAWETVTGLRATSWQTKHMTTRWGTCNVRTGKLWFNVQLAQKPPECLDYIILHEVLHLKERKHNAHFYGMLDLYMPGWKSINKRLNEKTDKR
jgi:predicted metal-dependent hydrolase